MDSQLKSLISNRGHIKSALTRFKHFFETFGCDTDVDVLEKRFKMNAPLYERFDEIQTQIDTIVAGTDQEATHANERDTFELIYFEVMTKVEKHISRVRSPQGSPQSSAVPSAPLITDTQVTPRLPTIVLPNFDGNYNNWLKFRDTFESLIHNNELLSDIQRFHYLNSALKGSAARVVHSLGVSDANYKLAWSTLKKRFEDPKALIHHHATAFLRMPSIQRQSSSALRDFIDTANNHILALGALGESVDSWDTLIILILSEKLDSVTSKEWEKQYLNSPSTTKFSDFIDFIEQQAKFLERTSSRSLGNVQRSSTRQIDNGKPLNKFQSSVAAHVASTQLQCLLCNGEHMLQHCAKLKAMPHADRHETVKRLRCCFNCLLFGHSIKTCTRGNCRKCNKKHHTLLHYDNVTANNVESTQPATHVVTRDSSLQTFVSNTASFSFDYTVLSTALVNLEDNQGKVHECRALLDVGSQAHFITESFCKKLGITHTTVNTNVTSLGKAGNNIHSSARVTMKSRCNSFRVNLSCLVIKDITDDMPNVPLDRMSIPIPAGITLADPHFATPGRVDLLIGAALFWQLLCVGQHKTGLGKLVWHKTRLGWVLGGQVDRLLDNETKHSSVCHIVSNESLHHAIAQFWEIENHNSIHQHNKKEDDCELHFRDTTTRDAQGRYIVSILFNDKITELGESRSQAEKRLLSIERKLSRQPKLRMQYIQFMQEYETLGHMTRLDDLSIGTESNYYLPHHAVCKETSTTTKLRVVFDGSAKTSSGMSLNDTQLVGPTVQSDLFSILLRFRKHKFVLSADVEKMYRQVLVRPEDRRYQRILWRSDAKCSISTYELNTITYGTASAPFLATRVLREIGQEHSTHFPFASRVIIEDFYVDDLLTGCETIVQAQNLKRELTQILDQAGFSLRKWASNDNRALGIIDFQDKLEIKADDEECKILGLLWLTGTDELRYSVKNNLSARTSKRVILSEIAQIFDPLGLIGPVVTKAKLIMQQLWQLKVGWDESLSQDLHTHWSVFRAELNTISSLAIPRRVMCGDAQQVELHGFSDASEKAYGACIYLRTLDQHGVWTVQLLCSKSRVAPLKTISLPRLELCGALLLAQLAVRVKQAMQLDFDQEYYWSDSTIALAWIQGQPNKWKTFIANRTSEIQELTPVDSWGHVISSDNPADIISRGTSPDQLINSSLWWIGPSWLSQTANQWPYLNYIPPKDLPEQRKTQVACISATNNQQCDFFLRYSSYVRLQRITAYCLRFINNTLNKIRSERIREIKARDTNPTKFDNLTRRELINAETTLLKLVQGEHFLAEINSLKLSKPLPSKSKLLSLNPFVDNSGVLRVGGRLVNAPIRYDQKHPVIIPANHPLTTLLINNEHQRLLHAGSQHTLASLRTRFWILSGKNTVKRILHQCVKCFRAKPTGINYVMGNLPASRVTPARPFNTCGVDYAGPVLLKERGRSRVTHKAYFCIFVCFVTKAVHIELATDLSTDAFLNCLYRFISRRGRVQHIYSDNGTNFIGAKNELNELISLLNSKLHDEQIGNALSREQIQWHLIPPRSPHFGGLWESAVKSIKYHLKRVIGEQRMTFEELYTILTQIEACLNSRPLHPLSCDPNDLTPLTPGHFLIGDALTAVPQPDLLDCRQNRLNRYQLIQQAVQHFWKRWHMEYLHELQQRSKWKSTAADVLKVDSLVVIREDNSPPLKWRLGRILELHPGSDNIVRVATIKVADGVIKRPVTKICVLPQVETTKS